MIESLDDLLFVGEEENDNEWIFLDSCASRMLFLLRDRSFIDKYRKCRRELGTAHSNGRIKICGEGYIGSESVDHCPDLRRSILSLGRVHSWGITVKLAPNAPPEFIDRSNDVVLTGVYKLNMPCFKLCDLNLMLWNLAVFGNEDISYLGPASSEGGTLLSIGPVTSAGVTSCGNEVQLVGDDEYCNKKKSFNYNHLSNTVSAITRSTTRSMDKVEPDESKASISVWKGDIDARLPQRALNDYEKIQLLHNRMGHIYFQKLVDAYMRMRFDGYSIPRSMLSRKAQYKLPKCTACYQSGQRRHHMHPSGELVNLYPPGACMWLDIHVFMNVVAYDGIALRANFTDMASGTTLSYGMVTKDQLFDCLPLVLKEYHLRYGFKWKILRSDQEKSLNNECLAWLTEHEDIKFIASPMDTPELNGPSEGVNKVFGKMVAAMLHHSGRDKVFWSGAYDYAAQIKFVMPVMTQKGFMSPFEFLEEKPPNIKHYRVWGSKCFVLESRSDKRKDWHPRSVVGFFLKLSPSPIGYTVWIPELHDIVVSINVEFDESIPDPGVEYHRSLADDIVPVVETETPISTLKRKYIGKHFIEEDDGMLYKVVGIRILKDRTIVADVLLEGAKKKNRAPLQLADMIRMVEEPKNSQATAITLQNAIDLEQARAESSSRYRDSLSYLENVCKDVSPRVDYTADIALVRSDSVDKCTIESDVPICCSITSEGNKEDSQCFKEAYNDFDSSDSVTLVTDAIVAAIEAVDPKAKSSMREAPRDRRAMLKLPLDVRKKFIAAEEKELASIQEREVIECECPIPPGVKPIDSRLVYAWKDPVAQEGDHQMAHDTGVDNGTCEDLDMLAKCRLVMKDFYKAWDNLRETYAPTGRGVTFRLLMIICIILIMQCDHIDVNTAFLYASLPNPMYMNPPPGYPCRPGHCWKVVKALYGCRTAPREWYKVLRLFVLSLGFIQTVLDPCLFYTGSGDSFVMIYFYVDDILLFTKYGTEHGRKLKEKFFKRFKCKDLGRVKRFLGIWIDMSPDFSSLKLHQRPYCEKVIEKYYKWWSSLYPTSKKTPLPQDIQERLAKDEPNPVAGDKYFEWWDSFPYLQMIGTALYLAINTRIDIMFAVCMLARYSNKKTIAACKALSWMFSYLAGTVDVGINYGSFEGKTFTECLDMFGFSDADWASDLRTRRSTAGYIVFCCGGPLAWGSKLMTTIAASSMESEYMSAYYLGQMMLYVRNLLSELGLKLMKPTPFFMDAMAAIQALKNPVFHARTKHIDIKWHWLRNHMESNFDLYHVRSIDMTADLLTKMAVFRVWYALVPHLIGKEIRTSEKIIAAQHRDKEADFPAETEV